MNLKLCSTMKHVYFSSMVVSVFIFSSPLSIIVNTDTGELVPGEVSSLTDNMETKKHPNLTYL